MHARFEVFGLYPAFAGDPPMMAEGTLDLGVVGKNDMAGNRCWSLGSADDGLQ